MFGSFTIYISGGLFGFAIQDYWLDDCSSTFPTSLWPLFDVGAISTGTAIRNKIVIFQAEELPQVDILFM